jgi:hypothetical protein
VPNFYKDFTAVSIAYWSCLVSPVKPIS